MRASSTAKPESGGAEILDYRTDVQLYSPSWAVLRSRSQDDSFRGRRDVFFTQAIPEGFSRRGNAPLEFGPPRCRRLLRTVGWKMRLRSQCVRTMPTGCVLRFVSFVGPIGRLLWCRTFLSLKPGFLTIKICHDALPAHFGCRPMKIPTRLGLKSAKWITHVREQALGARPLASPRLQLVRRRIVRSGIP